HTRSYGDWSSDVCSSDLSADVSPHGPTERSSAVPWRAAEPAKEGDDDNGWDERAPPGGQAERRQCARARLDEQHDRARPCNRARSEERRVGKEVEVRWGG